MRTKIEEFGNRSAHDIEAVRARDNEIMQSVEALVASLRIEQVHQQLTSLDLTIAQTSASLGSRADDSDRRVIQLTVRPNATTGPFEVARDTSSRLAACDSIAKAMFSNQFSRRGSVEAAACSPNNFCSD